MHCLILQAIRTLAAVILFISTAIASNFMHIREAFAAAQQVFAGGSQVLCALSVVGLSLRCPLLSVATIAQWERGTLELLARSSPLSGLFENRRHANAHAHEG